MKKNLLCFILLFLLAGSLLSACGKDEKKDVDKPKLPKEFTLEYSVKEGEAEALDGLVFDEVISTAKVSSLAHDATGSSLGYILEEEALDEFIRLIQEESIWGVRVSKEDYQGAVRSARSGFMIEFLDSTDRFQNGIARITCVTSTAKNYMNLIQKGKKAENYRIALPDKVVDFLNKKSAENYNESSSNPGWFDKAFNK